ncbi:MAG TPA: alpha-L-arabinofuranosidase C-terminal domain-containing protein, partial [Croceibacterium sp.]|nr:alpha-L-arabinofuranosidase C-terminal domain-containing protein [Croceibacterium sp.]
YLRQMTIHSRFARNFNPAQQKDGAQMLKIAVGPGGDGPRWTEWTETIMRAYKNRQWSWDMHGLSLHNYTVVRFPASYKSVGFDEADYALLLSETLKMDGLIRHHGAIMDAYDPQKRVALVVDEWGAWYAQLPGTTPGFLAQQNSIRDALIAALNINIFARHADRVRMANIAQMVNVLQALILTDGPRMVRTPTYWIHQMYLPMQDATLIPVRFDAGTYTRGAITLPAIDALALRDTSGKLWLSLVNLDPHRSREVTLEVPGITVRRAQGQVLTAPNVNSVNTFDDPDAVTPNAISGTARGGKVTVTLPAKSVAMISIER